MTDIRRNMDITGRNTFGMRVKAACVVEYDSTGDLEEIRGMIASLPAPVLHIGGGSNLLFTKDFPGTLLHSGIRFIRHDCPRKMAESDSGHKEWQSDGQEPGCQDVAVEVGAGVIFDDFCAWAAEKGLWGVENLSHIPGETGAAAVQNIGAYGVEIKDVIDKVNCYDMVLGREVSFKADECGYGYRDSLFKRDRKGRYIVTSVTFRLSANPKPVLDYGHIRSAVESSLTDRAAIIRNVIVGIRKSKLPEPSEMGSAGSFFKNPVVPKSDYDRVASIATLYNGAGCSVPHYDMGSGFVKIPAAWLIEQCGWKGYREGNVGVYERQPLVIVNVTGEATPDEVIALEDKIVSSVRERFGITLHPEVEHI